MRQIPKEKINQWYREEYQESFLGTDSVYKESPEQLQKFYQLLWRNKDQLKSILDLGCGDGRSLIELAKEGFEVTGLDLSGKEQAEKRANVTGVKIRFIEGDIITFPFDRDSYDVVISSEVMHLLERKEVVDVLKKIKQAVSSKGFVYISILSNLKRVFRETKEEFQYEGQADYSSEEAYDLLRREFSDWEIIELDDFFDEQDWPVKEGNYPIAPYHWSGNYVYLIARRKTSI